MFATFAHQQQLPQVTKRKRFPLPATLTTRGEKEPSGSRCYLAETGEHQVTETLYRRLGGAMKGRALSTGCPGLYLRGKGFPCSGEIDLIYVGPFSATD